MSADQAATGQAIVRLTAFLREEIETLPQGHPLASEYRAQLAQLDPFVGVRGAVA